MSQTPLAVRALRGAALWALRGASRGAWALSAAAYRRANVPNPTAFWQRAYLRGSSAALGLGRLAGEVEFANWRERHDFPHPGWAASSGMDQLGADGATRAAQPHAVNACLDAPDAPWGDRACDADMRALLSAKARMLAGEWTSALGAAHVAKKIPPGRSDLERHFRLALSEADPLWHERAMPEGDPLARHLMADPGTMAALGASAAAQRALLESVAIEGSLSPAGPAEPEPPASPPEPGGGSSSGKPARPRL